jgi:hypothetical protein
MCGCTVGVPGCTTTGRWLIWRREATPCIGCLAWKEAAILELIEDWGPIDRSHRKLAHRGRRVTALSTLASRPRLRVPPARADTPVRRATGRSSVSGRRRVDVVCGECVAVGGLLDRLSPGLDAQGTSLPRVGSYPRLTPRRSTGRDPPRLRLHPRLRRPT